MYTGYLSLSNGHGKTAGTFRDRNITKADIKKYLQDIGYEVGEDNKWQFAFILIAEDLFKFHSLTDEGIIAVRDFAIDAIATKDLTTWDVLVSELNNRKEWVEVFGSTAVREVIAEVMGTPSPDILAHELPELDVTM